MDQHKANVINPRKSLCWIKKNTVAGMVNRFTQKIESANDVADRKPAKGPIARQVPFCADFSTINEGTGDVIESKLDSVDSGYDSFRHRSRSVNTSKSLLAEYKKFPNFKFSQLKYFGVDPKEYLSAFDIDYDPVSDSIRKDSSDGEAIGGEDNVVIAKETMRKRSQTMSFKRTLDSTAVKVSSTKYFAAESREQDNAKKNRPVKVASATDRSDHKDVFVTKVASRDSENSLRSIATQTSPEKKFQSVDADVVALCGKAPPKRPSKRGVDRKLTSRIQQSIKSYDRVLKSLRKNDISKKKRAGFDA